MKSTRLMMLFVCLALVAATVSAQEAGTAKPQQKADATQQELLQVEKQLWEAWKQGDAKPFERHLTQDSIGVGVSGVGTKDEMVKEIAKKECQVASFSIDEQSARTVRLDPNTVLLTYRATQDATCGGQKIPNEVYASSVFVKKQGRWQAAFHQETPSLSSMQQQQAAE